MRHRCREPQNARQGSMLVLMALLLPIAIILAGYAINLAYMELNRTEMYIAADAAARAGGREFTLTGSTARGRAVARDAAARNLVSGQAPQLSDANLVFGESSRGGLTQRYNFSPGGAHPNALQVTIDYSAGSLGGSLPLLMPRVAGIGSFSPQQTARSTQLEVDIALVVDRSGSMAFAADEPAVADGTPPKNAPNPFDFPNRWQPGLVNDPITITDPDTGETSTQDNWVIGRVPRPWSSLYCDPIIFECRWVDLLRAVNVFVAELNASPTAERVSMVSYSTDATIDQPLSDNYAGLSGSLSGYTAQFCGGYTNIADGIRVGQNSLAGGNSRPWASKVMIVLTDGIRTAGGSPKSAARDAAEEGILIFTITFALEADQSLMQDVAEIGNGKHYHASDAATLQQAFVEIARQIPVVLTQ